MWGSFAWELYCCTDCTLVFENDSHRQSNDQTTSSPALSIRGVMSLQWCSRKTHCRRTAQPRTGIKISVCARRVQVWQSFFFLSPFANTASNVLNPVHLEGRLGSLCNTETCLTTLFGDGRRDCAKNVTCWGYSVLAKENTVNKNWHQEGCLIFKSQETRTPTRCST